MARDGFIDQDRNSPPIIAKLILLITKRSSDYYILPQPFDREEALVIRTADLTHRYGLTLGFG